MVDPSFGPISLVGQAHGDAVYPGGSNSKWEYSSKRPFSNSRPKSLVTVSWSSSAVAKF